MDMNNMNNNMMNMPMFAVGDRISYHNNEGTVSRINILGMRPCCAIQIIWDDTTKISQILQMNQLNDVVKL